MTGRSLDRSIVVPSTTSQSFDSGSSSPIHHVRSPDIASIGPVLDRHTIHEHAVGLRFRSSDVAPLGRIGSSAVARRGKRLAEVRGLSSRAHRVAATPHPRSSSVLSWEQVPVRTAQHVVTEPWNQSRAASSTRVSVTTVMRGTGECGYASMRPSHWARWLAFFTDAVHDRATWRLAAVGAERSHRRNVCP